MNRRGFLGTLLAGAGLLVLPEEPRVRVYSFASREFLAPERQAHLAFERALRISAETNTPVPPGVYEMHGPIEFPDGAMLADSVVNFGPKGSLELMPDTTGLILRNFFKPVGTRIETLLTPNRQVLVVRG